MSFLYNPLQTTRSLALPPGEYTLRCFCSRNTGGHSAWHIVEGHKAPVTRATFVTLGCYPEKSVCRELHGFTNSLTKLGLLANVQGVGTRYTSHIDAKILRLREFVAQQSAEFIVYADGRDSLVLKGESEIMERFSRFETDFVISMERECWPICNQTWADCFPDAPDQRRWPNAGGWMGTHKGVLRVLDECIALLDRVKKGTVTEVERFMLPYLTAHYTDDQLFLQALYLQGRFRGDTRAELFVNMNTASLMLHDNPDFEVTEGKVRVRATGTSPIIVHFSGEARKHCMDQFAAQFGLCKSISVTSKSGTL